MTTTGTVFTADAAARLADYLRHVRAALAGVPGVSADEVEADILEHVAAAVRPAGNAVTAAELEPVLRDLGPPAGWRPATAPAGFDPWAWVKSVGATLVKGPEDWRLAYLCLGLTTLAPLTAGFTLVPAYFLGRAAAELVHRRGGTLGARRWLVYPAVVAVSLPLLLVTAVGPPAAVAIVTGGATSDARVYRNAVAAVADDGVVTFRPGVDPNGVPWLRSAGLRESAPDKKGVRVWRVADADRRTHDRTLAAMDRLGVLPEFQPAAATAFATAGALLAWGLVLAGLAAAFPASAAAVFHPLLDGVTPRHGLRLAAGCTLLLAAWAGYATRL